MNLRITIYQKWSIEVKTFYFKNKKHCTEIRQYQLILLVLLLNFKIIMYCRLFRFSLCKGFNENYSFY